MGKDLDGTKKVISALADLKGVGISLANAIMNALKIDGRMRLGALNERQISEIHECLKDPSRIRIPPYILNHRRDPETGLDTHLIGPDLDLAIKSEIEKERAIGSWRGVRHSLGLKVRGQRTRTTGKKGKTVGVKKVAVAKQE